MTEKYIPNKEFVSTLKKFEKEVTQGSGPIHEELLIIFKLKEERLDAIT